MKAGYRRDYRTVNLSYVPLQEAIDTLTKMQGELLAEGWIDLEVGLEEGYEGCIDFHVEGLRPRSEQEKQQYERELKQQNDSEQIEYYRLKAKYEGKP